MKGAHKRYMQRNTKKTFDQSMHLYEQTLNQVVQASGNGVRHDTSDRTKTIRVGDPVAVRCSDNTDYYRTVLIRKNQFSNKNHLIKSLHLLYTRKHDVSKEEAKSIPTFL